MSSMSNSFFESEHPIPPEQSISISENCLNVLYSHSTKRPRSASNSPYAISLITLEETQEPKSSPWKANSLSSSSLPQPASHPINEESCSTNSHDHRQQTRLSDFFTALPHDSLTEVLSRSQPQTPCPSTPPHRSEKSPSLPFAEGLSIPEPSGKGTADVLVVNEGKPSGNRVKSLKGKDLAAELENRDSTAVSVDFPLVRQDNEFETKETERVTTSSSGIAFSTSSLPVSPFQSSFSGHSPSRIRQVEWCDQQARFSKQATLSDFNSPSQVTTLQTKITDLESRLRVKEQRVEELDALVLQQEEEKQRMTQQGKNLEMQLEYAKSYRTRVQSVLREVMLDMAANDRRENRRQLHALHFELGEVASWHVSGKEVWIEGDKPKAVIRERIRLKQRREEVEGIKKTAERRLKQLLRTTEDVNSHTNLSGSNHGPPGAGEIGGQHTNSCEAIPHQGIVISGGPLPPPSQSASNTGFGGAISEQILELEKCIQLSSGELSALNAMMGNLKQQQHDLESQKRSLLKEIRRISDEDSSELMAVPSLGEEGCYIPISLLGKGGFSEVWKAFDLHHVRYVALKVHRVGREWTAQYKKNYLRHAERELEIMRNLQHPHLIQLYDVFEYNDTSFVSVMEFSEGTDLDTYLKRYTTLKESDAKLIFVQIVSALRYLADQPQPVIHYDLKPANILFHSNVPSCLAIKITDFGLSKIIAKKGPGEDDPSIDLTSQGTGTYWYLPPECFDTATVPRISNKVDIWACGVIFYQMLYGKRPFAEGESQRKIWHEKLIIQNARSLVFPDVPKVSNEAKDVIRRCLAFHTSDRYDVYQLSSDPYLTRRRTGKSIGRLSGVMSLAPLY